MERVDGKAAGAYGFITCQRIGLADGARADAIPNAAGGQGGHGAAKLEAVIHWYVFRHPFHQSPTRRLAACRLFLTFSTHLPSPPPPSSEGPIWLHELYPQNGLFSIYPAHHLLSNGHLHLHRLSLLAVNRPRFGCYSAGRRQQSRAYTRSI
jgi:hypothetical protein